MADPRNDTPALNILVLGAAYGLLPAMRMLTAGHAVTVVCRDDEQAAIAQHGAQVVFRKRDGTPGRKLEARAEQGISTVGVLGLVGPEVDVSSFDCAVLAMGEPQYAAPEVAALIKRIADAQLPVLSIMNAPPPPFLRRLENLDVDALSEAYTAWDVWQTLEPSLVTAASPDAQAVRTDPEVKHALTVTLGSNFKVAPFADAQHQEMFARISRDVSAYRPDGTPFTVRMMAHRDVRVPLAKWPMLIAGNCRCLRPDGSIRSIFEAVHDDLGASQEIYDRVQEIVRVAGAEDKTMVPFDAYATAAKGLVKPSSFARAIAAGAPAVERVDKLVQLAGRSIGVTSSELDRIVTQVDGIMAR